jgi:hypothetical protein
VIGIALLGACYTYAPIEPATAAPGMGVRARVSPTASARIAPLLGAQDARVLNGTIISNERDTMIVEVPVAARRDAIDVAERLNQRVSIPRSDVVELESRRPDRLRTAAVAGGAALFVGALAVKSLTNEPGKEKNPGGPGPDDLWSPLFRRVP